MEEARLTAYLFQKLQDAVFLTERNMARQLGLSYKALRQIQAAQSFFRRREQQQAIPLLRGKSRRLACLRQRRRLFAPSRRVADQQRVFSGRQKAHKTAPARRKDRLSGAHANVVYSRHVRVITVAAVRSPPTNTS